MPVTEFIPGALIDGYLLLDRIGGGGEATVWKAQDRSGNTVALRAPSILRTPLNHPNIVPILAVGTNEGTPYTVMPYLGCNLRRRVPLPLDEALEFSRQILNALQFAHEHGVVHGDLKPENILLDRRHAFLADFAEPLPVSELSMSLDTGAPQTRRMMATLPYLAPELRRGQKPDARSDIFSFGAILYEMLTGRTPEGAFRLPSQLVPGVPASLDEILRGCLAPEPSERWTCAAVSEALQRAEPTPSAAISLGHTEVSTLRELADYAVESRDNWMLVAALVESGDLESWLRRTRHFDLARSAGSMQLPAPLALGKLLEQAGLYAPPTLDASPESVDLGTVPHGEQRTVALRVMKQRRGYAAATVRVGDPFMTALPQEVVFDEVAKDADEGTIIITLDTAGLESARAFRTWVEIADRRIPMTFTVTPKPAALEVDDASWVCVGYRDRLVKIVLRNGGDLPFRADVTCRAPWLRVPATIALQPHERRELMIHVAPSRAPLVQDDTTTGKTARTEMVFSAESARTIGLALTVLPAFDAPLACAGFILSLVPVVGELIFLAALARTWGTATPRNESLSFTVGAALGTAAHLALLWLLR